MDHLRWLERECLGIEVVTLRGLERYMGLVGAEVATLLGEPWRTGKRPYGQDALSTAAACLKGFYLHQASRGISKHSANSSTKPGCRRGRTVGAHCSGM
ncbi:hypothetical protein [Fodinicola feengrottensis]|uniref:Transposase n=1 Tax=Fodinicola feengrottensis TaxID=435914 RepID=A0ABP4SJN6_9ACTN|nr:hypothetical protein [Fodinicola feengrottensis]